LTRADFDNLHVSPSSRYDLLSLNFLDNPDRPLGTNGGTWTVQDAESPYGIYQTNTNVLATAVGGAPIDDQRVRSYVRLESFGSATPVPWFGVIARYQDPSNYYYLSVRGSGTLQIRKIVNGVTTLLAAKDFTVNPGEFHQYELHVVGDQLHASVDGVLLATAHDSDLPVGRHGIATYHAAAYFNSVIVDQP
jgi:pectate lyase